MSDIRGHRFKDLTGLRFGFLTVVEFHAMVKSGTMWKLKCDCGNEVFRLSSNIQKKHVHSCGCKPTRPARKDAGFNRLIRDYIASATNRGHVFALSEDEFRSLISKNCYYCGSFPTKRYEKQVVHTLYANGIDRIDSSIGYITTNVVTCCAKCNVAKNKMSQQEFLTLIENIYNNRIKS